MFQAKAFTELAKRIKEQGKTIWCYTGFTFEQCCADPIKYALLEHIDVLVDGRYIEEKYDSKLFFRGSSNQRMIDVPKSLETGECVLFEYDPMPKF